MHTPSARAPMRRGAPARFCSLAVALALVTWVTQALADPTQFGRVVVAHDVNTLSTSLAGTQESRFAVNVANFLTETHATRNLLLFESSATDHLRDYATVVVQALQSAGFAVTVTTNYATAYQGYDAVFVGIKYPGNTGLANVPLVDYVLAGGGVYLFGGVDDNAANEAAVWNAFLGTWGLSFGSPYNPLVTVPITSQHPLFAGVNTLKCGIGSPIVAGTLPSNANILQSTASGGVYAIAVNTAAVGVPRRDEPGPELELAVGPTPSRGGVNVTFTLPHAMRIAVAVYDLDGRQVAVLARGADYDAGRHVLMWNPRAGAAGEFRCGVYFVSITGEGTRRTQRAVILE